MNTTAHRPSALAAHVSALAVAAILGACGGARSTMPAHTAALAAPPAVPPAQAPGTSSSANTPTASNVVISEEVLRACNIPDGDAYFAFDSSRITAFDRSPLDAVATCFTRGPMASRNLRLVGHADPRGASEYNVSLGQARADAVASYLADKGVSRLHEASTSRGAMDATGRDETGWAHDRRVDVLLAD